MVVERFTLYHIPALNSWLKAHGHPIPALIEYPELGYIACDANGPIAAGFLRRVEGGYAQIDGLTSNPGRNGADRHQAIDMVAETLIEKARSLKISAILVLSQDESTIMRSERHGFRKLPHTLLGVDLNSRGGS